MCTSGNSKVSEKTKKHAAYLCAYICRKLGITGGQVDTCVLRHYDVTHKRCPAQMVDSPDEWKAFKKQVKDILNRKKSTGCSDSTKNIPFIAKNDHSLHFPCKGM